MVQFKVKNTANRRSKFESIGKTYTRKKLFELANGPIKRMGCLTTPQLNDIRVGIESGKINKDTHITVVEQSKRISKNIRKCLSRIENIKSHSVHNKTLEKYYKKRNHGAEKFSLWENDFCGFISPESILAPVYIPFDNNAIYSCTHTTTRKQPLILKECNNLLNKFKSNNKRKTIDGSYIYSERLEDIFKKNKTLAALSEKLNSIGASVVDIIYNSFDTQYKIKLEDMCLYRGVPPHSMITVFLRIIRKNNNRDNINPLGLSLTNLAFKQFH